ncbi:MAG: hypothetical protein A2664_04640 [Candidatus Taylorbacteria bacterium RIFCSPHIGHO2_01_FULL_46_22b]|uniref:Phosphomannomutase n=1 Tax=Candidatus Taylorbacteria bacterium RIFCSPHIGHO2_01_FULL_46_22b TaxID=1802301 RepID=A0A1G2M4C4_9BACT|nr:MAG: hypothetical protein A2664_04640 [Candidatus Taylorbacteria bacterium RIFCSPHIGHO2_01_FULL_46_22b]
MKINPEIFRAYDLRGVNDRDLNPVIVEHIGKAFGTYVKHRGGSRAIVGRDSRKTSPAYSQAMIAGIRSTGIDVIDIGMNLVGTFYWSQYYLKNQWGVFITASHNPPEFNGCKFANDFSETLVSEGMQELRDIALRDDIEMGKEGKLEVMDIREAYFSDLIKRLPIENKFRVVVDPSGTTAGSIIPALLRKAGCEVIEKHCEIDPNFFEGAADPTESKIAERIRAEVLEAKADIGFSYDADGDRIGIVDEKGGIIWNDVLVALFAADVLKDHPKSTIMYNTLCSKAVKEVIEREGGRPFMWRTGHSFLKKKNQEVKAAFIGELSGHFFFSKDFYNHDDGAYSTLRLLRYLSRSRQTLSEAIASIPHYESSPEIKLYVSDKEKVVLMKKISPVLRTDYPNAEIIDDERAGDGIRLELSDAMFVVRYSQNGPYITIKFEAKTKNRYEEIKQYLHKLLHTYKEVDWDSKISVNGEALD